MTTALLIGFTIIGLFFIHASEDTIKATGVVVGIVVGLILLGIYRPCLPVWCDDAVWHSPLDLRHRPQGPESLAPVHAVAATRYYSASFGWMERYLNCYISGFAGGGNAGA